MNIRETVEKSLTDQGVPLSPQYAGYANHVITALETREAEIVENLMLAAREQELNLDTVRRSLADCGLTVPLAPVSDDPRDAAIAAMERQIEEMQSSLRELRDEG